MQRLLEENTDIHCTLVINLNYYKSGILRSELNALERNWCDVFLEDDSLI